MAAKISTAPAANPMERVSVPIQTDKALVITAVKGIATATKEGSSFFRQAVRINQHNTVEISTMPT